jgi:site-specific recombinase XerD
MNDVVVAAPAGGALEVQGRQSHTLGSVADDWQAIEVWLRTVQSNSRNRSTATVDTYRFHLAKLRWFCERVIGRTSSMQDVEAFRDFLADLPDFALCMGNAGSVDYTPFRVQPSPSSQSDIMRFTRAMFGALHATGYVRLNPMALTKAPASRELNVSRAINLDLYDTVLQVMDAQDSEGLKDRRGYLRDRFILVCLRESGLRASELVGARMGAFKQFSDPKVRKTYWVLDVVADDAKGGKARTVPVTKVLMDARHVPDGFWIASLSGTWRSDTAVTAPPAPARWNCPRARSGALPTSGCSALGGALAPGRACTRSSPSGSRMPPLTWMTTATTKARHGCATRRRTGCTIRSPRRPCSRARTSEASPRCSVTVA